MIAREAKKTSEEVLGFTIEPDPNFAVIRNLDGDIIRHANERNNGKYYTTQELMKEHERLVNENKANSINKIL